MSSTRISLVYGAAGFGSPTSKTATVVTKIEDAQAIVDVAVELGVKEFDTSNYYGDGTSEQYLGQLNLGDHAIVDTKIPPPGHTAQGLRTVVEQSQKSLGAHKINILYLHAPDRSVPYEETCRAMNDLHKQGAYKEFGLSNYNAWEVAEIVYICKNHGWIQPTVYQGRYNALSRNVETELFPCLRKFGIRFYAYSPLAGGLLTGKYRTIEELNAAYVPGVRNRWNQEFPWVTFLVKAAEPILPIYAKLDTALEKHNIKMAEAALRWLQHHSALAPGDALVFGASKPEQVRNTVNYFTGGPLPDEIIQLLEEAWKAASPYTFHYAL